MYRRQTPELRNPLNAPAVAQLIIGYDNANSTGDDGRRFAFGNALTAIRATLLFVNTLEIATTIKFIGAGSMGQYVVDANNNITPFL